MKEKTINTVGIYCSLVDDVVLLSVNGERISMLGGEGYAICSVCCDYYIEKHCQHHGRSCECNAILKQAILIAKNRAAIMVK